MVWTGNEEKLSEFLNYINEAHATIKFTWAWCKKCVNYLDVQVMNTNVKNDTDLYTKPTDKHQLNYFFLTLCVTFLPSDSHTLLF